MMLHYRLLFEPDDDGTILVTSPDLPIVTYGVNEEDALQHASDAIDLVLESMMNARESVPIRIVADDASMPVYVASLQTELKVRLHQAMRAADLTRAELARRLKWHREQVDRLFRLDHNSRIEQIEDAFAALEKVVRIDIEDARTTAKAAA